MSNLIGSAGSVSTLRAGILVVGDVMLDHYVMGMTSRISPEAPVPIVKIQKEHSVPGGAANVALNIAAMGSPVLLIGMIGKDTAGEQVENLLSVAHVETCFEKVTGPTIKKSRVMSHHQQMLRLDYEESFAGLSKTALEQHFEEKLNNKNRSYGAVVLSDYGKGTLSNPQALIQRARQQGIPVFVDPKGSDFSRYYQATVITPNFSEFIAVVGACRTEEEIVQKAQNLIKKLELKALLITRSAEGMTLVFPEGSCETVISIPTEAHEVFDVTGAGDTSIAHFALAVAEGKDLITAMKLANRAAGLVVGKLGAATVTREELVNQERKSVIKNLKMGILTEAEAEQEVLKAKKQRAKVVFTNGCFDLLHSGHLTYLAEAKALGDYLIVAVNTDESVAKLKGPDRPVKSLQDRMEMLAALKAVDWVVPFPDDTPERVLRLIQPDVLVKGGDYVRETIAGFEFVSSYGGEVKILSFVSGVSTTQLIEKIKS